MRRLSLLLLSLPLAACSSQQKPAVEAPSVESSAGIQRLDLNRDGRPELTKYFAPAEDGGDPRLEREELDLNWDGKVDIWRVYGPGGKVTEERWDADFDGTPDETRSFKGGVIVKARRDHNNDGQIDVTRFYEGGKLVRKETDSNQDGKVDRWEYFNGRLLDRIGVDKDHDGTVDAWIKAGGEEAAPAPAAQADAS